MTPEKRQSLITVGVVGVLALIVAVLLVVTRGSDPATRPATGVSDDNTDAGEAVPAEVAIDQSPGYILARKAEEVLQKTCRPGAVDTTFNVVSFNIHSGHGRRGASLARIAAAIKELKADVVLLQEVDRGRSNSGGVDQPAYLAGQLDMVSAYGANARLHGGLIGNAILTRYPLVSAKNSPLPNAGGRQPRGQLHAVINVDGIEVSIFNHHLDFHGDSLKARQMQSAARLISLDVRPGIVGGDFNAFPASAAAGAARSVAQDPFPMVGKGSAATSPENRPRSRIDYVLHRGPGLTPLVTTVPPVLLSDHRPVFAAYRLTGERACTPPTSAPSP